MIQHIARTLNLQLPSSQSSLTYSISEWLNRSKVIYLHLWVTAFGFSWFVISVGSHELCFLFVEMRLQGKAWTGSSLRIHCSLVTGGLCCKAGHTSLDLNRQRRHWVLLPPWYYVKCSDWFQFVYLQFFKKKMYSCPLTLKTAWSNLLPSSYSRPLTSSQ